MATLAASFATVVVAGAVGLGLASLAATLSRRGHYGRHHYRYGRSAEDDTAAIERTMNLIRQQDFTGCGLKLVCDLASMRDGELTEEELDILALVGPSIKPGEGLMPGSALGEYRQARGLGEMGYDCAQVYPYCPYNSTQLIDSVMSYLP